ncbi:MAG: hypothetical protein ABSB91_01530 [Sedimentisphaerales bacterium]
MKTVKSPYSHLLTFVLLCTFSSSVFALSDAQFTINNNGLSSWRLDSYSPAEANAGPLAVANPTLNLVIGKRYDITDPNFAAHPFQLIAKAAAAAQDTILLSTGATVGSFESDPNVAWQDTGTATVSFTLTAALANAMSPDANHVPGYRCGVHTTAMRGNINIKAAPACGDPNHLPLAGDINGDCYVDFFDFALMAQNWLNCVAPGPPCNFMPWP